MAEERAEGRAEHGAEHPIEHPPAQHSTHGSHGDPDPEIPVGPVAKSLVAIAVVSLVAAALMWPTVASLVGWAERRSTEERVIDRARPVGPLLQQDPEADLDLYLARQAVAGASYGWVDQEDGIARIPLERATELVLERGLDLGVEGATGAESDAAAGAGADSASDPGGPDDAGSGEHR